MTIENTTIPRKYVYYQSDQPTGASNGDIWIDSDTNLSYFYSDPDWVSIQSDLSRYDDLNAKMAIDILRCLAHFTATPSDYDYIYLDNFSTTGGYSATIDAGNTDATFSSDHYQAVGSYNKVESTEAHSQTMSSTTSGAYKYGTLIKANLDNLTITKVTKHASSACTKAYVYLQVGGNPDSSPLGTATFSGNDATFNVALTKDSYYYVVVDADGSGYNTQYNNAVTYPINCTNISYTNGVSSQNTPNWINANTMLNVVSITTSANGDAIASTKYVQTNTLTMDSTLVGYQLYAKTADTGGACTENYQISFNNGSSWSSAKAFNTKYTDGSGTQIKLKIKLVTDTGSSSHSYVYNYALLVWY